MMPKDIVDMRRRQSGLFSSPVVSDSEKSLYILSHVPDESETYLIQDDRPPYREAFEMVKNYVGDNVVDELICKKFLLPHISNHSAIAKFIEKQTLQKGCSVTHS